MDFSTNSEVNLSGWEFFPLLNPSLPEPVATTVQYIELSRLQKGMNVLDLGAHAGISSLVFQNWVGPKGKVVAVEADPLNAHCARRNFSRYGALGLRPPALVEAAAWSEDGWMSFEPEGNLGSSVADVGIRWNPRKTVTLKSISLTSIVRIADFERVDLIKADIEGADHAVFSDKQFFGKFQPVIVFEQANSSQQQTRSAKIVRLLQDYGYMGEFHAQRGSRLPLIVANYGRATFANN